MTNSKLTSFRKWVLAGAASLAIAQGTALAQGEKIEFDIDADELGDALNEFGLQSGEEILFVEAETAGKTTNGVEGIYPADDALDIILDGSGIDYRVNELSTFLVGTVAARQAGPGAETGSKRMFLVSAQQGEERPDATDETVRESVEDDEVPVRDVIVVTGTNIRGIEDGPSPVLTFDRQAISNAGVGTLREFMATIPQIFEGGVNTGHNLRSSGTGGTFSRSFGSEINLRGLGTGTTLTLLNGRRLTTSDKAGYVDITAIPTSAIERVEILMDGASAIYGSDAIGGVINIILKDDFEGFETSARYGAATREDPSEYSLSQAAGAAWETGRFFATLDYFRQSKLSATDRDFSQNADFLPTDLIPGSERFSVLANGHQDFGNKLRFSVDVYYTKREADFVLTAVTGTSSENPTTETYGGVLGTTYDFVNDWQGDLAIGLSKSEIATEDTLIVDGQVARIVTAGNDTSTYFADIIFDGPAYQLPGDELKLAFGGSFRQVELEANVPTLDGVAFPDAVFFYERDVASAFAELHIPIVGAGNVQPGIERLEVSAALRHDDYSDFGSTTNPKFGALWEIASGFLIRGTYGTSFRAPNFTELETSGTIVALGNLTTDLVNFSNQIPTLWISGGNPELRPEEATTWTAGVEWEARNIDGLRAAVSYYDIDFGDRIGSPGSLLTVFENEGGAFDPVVTLNPSDERINALLALASEGPFGSPVFVQGPLALPPGFDVLDIERILDLRLNNISATSRRGIDMAANYAFQAASGEIDLSLNADYVIEASDQFTETSPVSDVLNRIFKPADLNVRGGVGYRSGGFFTKLYVNYVSDYVDDISEPQIDVSSWTTVDLTAKYAFQASESDLTDGLTVSASVRNILDEDPPEIATDIGRGTGFDPTNANPLGRFISVTVTKRW